MLKITIPDYGQLQLQHLVLDFNGTLACDGKLLPGAAQRLNQLAEQLRVHIITADTFGSVAEETSAFSRELVVISPSSQDKAKDDYVRQLGPATVIAVGNGRNDRLMLKSAVLGIATVQTEGAATEAIQSADLLVPDILAALDLLINPKRLIATLRN